MAFNNNSSTDLSRFSIGEIQDLTGVPSFYNAGSSKWLQSAVSTSSSNLSNTTKTNLANAGTAASPTVLVQSTLSLSSVDRGFYASYPIQRISASSISVVPAVFDNTTTVGVGVATSAGLQAVATGQTSIRTNSGTGGTNGFVASNDTTIFSYTFTSATALSAYSTTNGTTWTAQSVTGLPVFAAQPTTIAHASQISSGTYTVASTSGWKRTQSANSQFAVFWCGARFLLVGPGVGVTSYVASLSTNGFTFGGDNTLAILGSTTLAVALDMQFYKNGNNCYLNIGSAFRYSTDGGVTWAAATFAGSPNPSNYFLQYNTTDPAKLVIVGSTGSTIAYYSTNSGQTWSADRPLPFSNNHSLQYKGSVLTVTNAGSIYKVSTDDGVTWATPTFPVGTLGVNITFFADANRFYAGVRAQPQLLTSSDGITWTLITLPQNFSIGYIGNMYGCGVVPYDSNTVALLGYNTASGYNQCIFTTDGGVTWTGSQFTTGNQGGQWGVGTAFLTPDAGGIGFVFGMSDLQSPQNNNVLKTDITAGGAFYRTGTVAVSPIRTNATAYVRVG